MSQTPDDLNRAASSPESVVQDQGRESFPENAVHVMTANHGGKKLEPSAAKRAASQKPAPSQKPKRTSAVKPTNKKGKHDAPTVPRKPEDLIKEAMVRGQQTPPANKRDAQYRKSYAYKIWKERGSQELATDSTEQDRVSAAKNKLPGTKL